MSFYLTEGDYFFRSDINKQIRDIIIHGREFAFYKTDMTQLQQSNNKMLIKLLKRSVFNFLRQRHWLVNIHRLMFRVYVYTSVCLDDWIAQQLSKRISD